MKSSICMCIFGVYNRRAPVDQDIYTARPTRSVVSVTGLLCHQRVCEDICDRKTVSLYDSNNSSGKSAIGKIAKGRSGR